MIDQLDFDGPQVGSSVVVYSSSFGSLSKKWKVTKNLGCENPAGCVWGNFSTHMFVL